MNTRTKSANKLSEQEIDRIVVDEANDENAWEKPVRVHRSKSASLSLSPDLAVRVAFLAQLHRTPSVEEWLTRVILERVEFEEAAFADLRQKLAVRNG